MDSKQVLRVGVAALELWTGWQFFYATMGKDGRVIVPKLARELLKGKEERLEGYVMDVTLEPA